jgi:hypothetical protein
MRGRAGAAMHGAAALLLFLGTGSVAGPLSAQTWRTITSARQVQGEQALDVHVQYGAGRFRVSPGAAGELYRMELRYDEEKFAPVREYHAATGVLRLGLQSRQGSGIHVNLGDRRDDGEKPSFALELAPDVPLALTLEMGAVEADAEFGGLSLTRMHLRTGASETRLRFSNPNPVACDAMVIEAGAAKLRAEHLANANCARITVRGGVGEVSLDFGGTWRRSASAEVSVGLGTLHLRLPRDVGVAVHLTSFLASFDAAGFQKRDGVYYSPNYGTAHFRLTLDVNASLGGVEVEWP